MPTGRKSLFGYSKQGAARVWCLKKKFGVSPVWYCAQLKFQNGLCAICKKPPSNEKIGFAVDHDHETGQVRGLLCYHCNLIVGSSIDRVFLLGRAIQYIETYREQQVPDKGLD